MMKQSTLPKQQALSGEICYSQNGHLVVPSKSLCPSNQGIDELQRGLRI